MSVVLGFAPQQQRHQHFSQHNKADNTEGTSYSSYLQHFGVRNSAASIRIPYSTSLDSSRHSTDGNVGELTNTFWHKARRAFVAVALLPVLLGAGISPSNADDELAKFAAAGNTVGVDGKCFLTQCPLETAQCANDRTCLKGLSCLAR